MKELIMTRKRRFFAAVAQVRSAGGAFGHTQEGLLREIHQLLETAAQGRDTPKEIHITITL